MWEKRILPLLDIWSSFLFSPLSFLCILALLIGFFPIASFLVLSLAQFSLFTLSLKILSLHHLLNTLTKLDRNDEREEVLTQHHGFLKHLSY